MIALIEETEFYETFLLAIYIVQAEGTEIKKILSSDMAGCREGTEQHLPRPLGWESGH